MIRKESILCDEDTYLLTLVRYIHLNPVRAGIVKSLGGLDHYRWTGHRAVVGKARYVWMDTGYVLAQFGRSRAERNEAYRQFVGDGFHMGHQPELTGGQLCGSSGGWSQVLSQQQQLRFRQSQGRLGEFIDGECHKSEISFNEP